MEDRIKALEKRQEILEADHAKWRHVVDEGLSDLTTAILGNIAQMRIWNKDLAEHFKSHSIDKKRKKEYISKRESFDKEDSL